MINIKDVKYEESFQDMIRDTELHLVKSEEVKDKEITLMLIAQTSLDQDVIKSLSEDEKVNLLNSLKVIHLEWQNIKSINRLDIFDKLEILYLQYNKIEKIDNLDLLINLQYLALNNNQIKKVENIETLQKLVHLDLGNNQIEDFDGNQIPEQVQMIVFKGNPVTQKSDYKLKLINSLPYVDQIDGQDINMEDKFKLLGIYPKKLEKYSSGVRNYYLENKEKIEKLQVLQGLLMKNKAERDIQEEEDSQEDSQEENEEEEEQEELQDLEKLEIEKEKLEKELSERQYQENSELSGLIENMLKSQIANFKPKPKQDPTMATEEVQRQVQDKTLRILEKQKEKTFQAKKAHLKKMIEEAELHTNKMTIIRGQRVEQTGRFKTSSVQNDPALKDMQEFMKQQLDEYEEQFVRNKINKAKMEESSLMMEKSQMSTSLSQQKSKKSLDVDGELEQSVQL